MQLGISSYISARRQSNNFLQKLFKRRIAEEFNFPPKIHELPPSLTYPGLISPELPNLLRAVVIGMFKVSAPQWKLKRQSPILTVKNLVDNVIKATKEPHSVVVQLTFINMATQKTIIVKVTPLEIYGRTTTDFKLDYYISLPPQETNTLEPKRDSIFNFAKSLTSKLGF